MERLVRCWPGRVPSRTGVGAMVALLWRSGLGVSEVGSLGAKHVDLVSGPLVVQHGKGDRRRLVGSDCGSAAVIARWTGARAERGVSGSPRICTPDGGPVSESYLRQLMSRLAGKAGIATRVYAPGLRHADAVGLEGEGATISTICDLLGHPSASVTDRYRRRLGRGEAAEFARNRRWST
jgi:site-specific recombinase XerD